MLRRPVKIQTHLFLLLLVSAALSACSPQPSPAPSAGGNPSAAGPRMSFKQAGVLRTYQAFYVEPVVAYTNDSGRLVPASSREIEDLADIFRQKIIRALEERHTLFNEPALNVAILRVTISDVWSDHTLLNLRPGLLLPNTMGGGASMEAEVIDSVTQEQVAFIADSRRGTRQGFMSGLTKWGGAKAAFDDWAMLLKQGIRKGSR